MASCKNYSVALTVALPALVCHRPVSQVTQYRIALRTPDWAAGGA